MVAVPARRTMVTGSHTQALVALLLVTSTSDPSTSTWVLFGLFSVFFSCGTSTPKKGQKALKTKTTKSTSKGH